MAPSISRTSETREQWLGRAIEMRGEEAIAAIKACGDHIAAGARRILELLEETG